MKRLALALGCVGLALTAAACHSRPPARPAFITGSGDASGTGDDDAGAVGDAIKGGKSADAYGDLVCESPDTFRGLRGWRRLTNTELMNTVADVFPGVSGVDFSAMPSDLPKEEIFDTVNVVNNYVNSVRFSGYQAFAQSLVDKMDLSKVLPCYAQGASCLSSNLPNLLQLAWRRPATADEVSTLVALFNGMKTDGLAVDAAMKWVIQAIVLSNNFLYRTELGTIQPDGSFALTDWELASALSYTIWRHPPNDMLRKMAANGELSKGDLKALATKMFDDPMAKAAFNDFGKMWFIADKITRTEKPAIPAYTADVKAKMYQEPGNLFANVMFDAAEKTYKQLMTSDYTMADPALDFIYGSKSSGGKTMYAQAERRGILGTSNFLAANAAADAPNPVLRGVFVAKHLLCEHFELPPPTTAPVHQEGLSNKELFKQHTKDGCAVCHAAIDDVGFTFENFDQMGTFRATDAGQAITVDGKAMIDGKSVPLTKPTSLGEALAASNQGPQCYVREAFRYAFGRTEYYTRPSVTSTTAAKLTMQGDLDRCQIDYATSKMRAANGDLKTGILELVGNPAFKIRLIGAAEK